MEHDKICSLILAFILTYFVPSLFLIPLLGTIIYSHPYAKPIFYYLNFQFDKINHYYTPQLLHEELHENNHHNIHNNLLGCQELLKTGKFCRFRPILNEKYCRRHIH